MSPAAFLVRHRVAFAALGASAALHAAVIGGFPATVRLLRDTGPNIYDVSLIAEPAPAPGAPRPAAPRAKRASPPRAGEAIARMPLLGEGDAPESAEPGEGDSPRLLSGADVPDLPERIAMAAPAAPIAALEIPPFPTQALPPKVSITYALSSIFADGRAEYTWSREGDRYEINGSMEAVGFFTVFLEGRITQQSRGTVTADGLRPESFVESRPGSPDEGLTFDWQRHSMTFNRNAETKEGPLTDNTVDWLSMIFQLDRKSTRLNSSHIQKSRMPSSA